MPYAPGVVDQRGQIIGDSKRRILDFFLNYAGMKRNEGMESDALSSQIETMQGGRFMPGGSSEGGGDVGKAFGATGGKGAGDSPFKAQAKTSQALDTLLDNEFRVDPYKLKTMSLGEKRGMLQGLGARQALLEFAQRQKFQDAQMNHMRLLDSIAKQNQADRVNQQEALGRMGYGLSKSIMGDYMENPERYAQRPMLAETIYQNPAAAAAAAPSLIDYASRMGEGASSSMPEGTTVRAGDVDVPVVFNRKTGRQEIVPGYSMAPKTSPPGAAGTDPASWTWQQKQEYTTLNQQIRDAQTELNKLRGKKDPAAIDSSLAILDRIQALEKKKRQMLGETVDDPGRFTIEPVE